MIAKNVLLVEGTDDEHVIKHICSNRGRPEIDSIQKYEGVDALLNSFPRRLNETDIGAIGVVVDADTDIVARWQSVRNKLNEAGYENVPEETDANGAILEPPHGSLLPKVGVWIMPNNKTNGILEDFLRFLVPRDSKLIEYVESSVAGIPKNERKFRKVDDQKAFMHTWLAWQEKPGLPFGTAIKARFLDSEVPQVDTLIAWLDRLFFS